MNASPVSARSKRQSIELFVVDRFRYSTATRSRWLSATILGSGALRFRGIPRSVRHSCVVLSSLSLLVVANTKYARKTGLKADEYGNEHVVAPIRPASFIFFERVVPPLLPVPRTGGHSLSGFPQYDNSEINGLGNPYPSTSPSSMSTRFFPPPAQDRLLGTYRGVIMDQFASSERIKWTAALEKNRTRCDSSPRGLFARLTGSNKTQAILDR